MAIPSIKRLESFFPGKGKKLRKLLESNEAVNESQAVIDWCNQCYNPPKMREKRLCAINEAINGCGTEAHFERDEMWPNVEWVNVGDMYSATIYVVNGRYKVGSMADFHHLLGD